MGQPNFDQLQFRVGNDDGAEDAHGWLGTLGQDLNIGPGQTIADGEQMFLRFTIINNGAKVGDLTPTIEMSYNAGTYATIGSTGAIKFASNGTYLTDGDNTTDRLGDGGSGGTFDSTNAGVIEGTATGAVNTYAINGYIEVLVVLQVDQSAMVNNGDTYDIRVAGLNEWTDIPRFTVANLPTPTLDQANFRIRYDTETLNSSTFDYALNANATIDLEKRFRIRFEVRESSGAPRTDTYKLQYNLNSGGWTDVATVPEFWYNRVSMAAIEAVTSTQYADADATTNVLSGATETFTAGQGVEFDNVTGSISLNNQHTEIEWTVLMHRIADGPVYLEDADSVQFRVVGVTSGAFDTYTNTPTVTVNVPAGLVGGTYVENPGQTLLVQDSNDNIYALIEGTATDDKILIMKSTDGGDTWAEQNTAGRPATLGLEGGELVKAGTQIVVLQHENEPFVHYFNMSTASTASRDTWSTTDEDPDSGILDVSEQQITGAYRSDGTIVAVYTGDTNATATNNDIWCNIRSTAGTWGTSFQVFNLTNNNNQGVVGVLGDSDNFYFFTIDNTASIVYAKRINGSTNALEDLYGTSSTASDNGTQIATNVGGSASETQTIINPLYWNDGSPRLFLAYKDTTNNDLYCRSMTAGAGGSISAAAGPINDSGVVGWDILAGRQAAAAAVRTSDGDIHMFFGRPTAQLNNSELWHDVSSDNGATWGTDTTVGIRSPLSRINQVDAFLLNNGNIGLFYDCANGIEQDSGGETGYAGYGAGFIWYDEYSISSGTTINLSTASIVAGGQIMTFTGGPVTISLNSASSTAGGQNINVVPGTVTPSLNTAQVTASGQSITITPGDVIKGLNTALLTATGQTLTITPEASNIALSTALLNATGYPITVTPGSVSISLATALAYATGQAISIDSGAIAPSNVNLNTATLSATGQIATIVPGSVSIALQTALSTLAGQGITLTPGEVSVALQTALANLTGQATTVTPGDVSIAFQTAIASLTGQTLGILPGDVSTALNTALLTLASTGFNVSIGGSVIPLSTATLIAGGQALTVTPGTANVALSTSVLNAIGQALAVVPGATSVTVNTAVLTADGQSINISIGYIIGLNTAVISANGQPVAVVPGAVETGLNTATMVANGIPITVVPGDVNVNLQTAAATIGAQAIQVLPGVYAVALNTANITANGINVSVQGGAVSIVLSTAALIADGQGLSITALAEVVAILRSMTLHSRDIDLSLLTRVQSMTLYNRTINMTLPDRDE